MFANSGGTFLFKKILSVSKIHNQATKSKKTTEFKKTMSIIRTVYFAGLGGNLGKLVAKQLVADKFDVRAILRFVYFSSTIHYSFYF